MKKILALLTTFLSLFIFSGCITWNIPFRASHPADQVDNVYIYYLQDGIQDLSLYQPIAKLENDEFESFIQEAEDLPFQRDIPVIPVPIDYYLDHQGYTVKIEYKDKSYDVLSRTCLSNSDGGTYPSKCEEEVWLAFLETYVDIEKE